MKKLSMITLGVRNLKRSIDFYQRVLDLQRIPFDSDTIAFFDLDELRLSLYPREALAEDAGVTPVGSGFTGITFAHMVANSAEVTAILKQAVDAGGSLIKEGQPVFWGGFSGYFADPDGFLWEVACDSKAYAQEAAEGK